MSLKTYLSDKLGMRIPWGAGGDKPAPARQGPATTESMLPARDSPHQDMMPERGGLKASELSRPDPIRHEIVNPSEPGDRSFMARVIDLLRGGETDSQPFGQQQHSPGFAGGMELNTPVVNEPEPMYPIAKSRVDTGYRGSGENARTDTSQSYGDPTGRGRW